jgi:hypothetical protein
LQTECPTATGDSAPVIRKSIVDEIIKKKMRANNKCSLNKNTEVYKIFC